MCGIAGIVDPGGQEFPPGVALLRSMIGAIRYRGPDEFGFYRDRWCGLANARLALLDLATGQQPLANEAGTIWVTFNGEIFNYRELRGTLERSGHRFRTHSDTEVIVHAFEEWGDECFPRFNGQWAIALWDSERRELTLSRDRVGICPLFVREKQGRVWFGSEVKAIFADPAVPREIDLRGLDQTFTYWATVAPQSLFVGIDEVPPGTVRRYGPDGAKFERSWWRPSFPTADGATVASPGIEEAALILREKLARASALRTLRADVPVGAYLSGGLDSSLIARMGRDAMLDAFATFSLCFEDAEFDESRHQQLVAASLRSRHIEVRVTRADIARVFPEVVSHAERPVLRSAPAPMFILSRAVREAGMKAVLTGEGGDEFFGGYDLFREAKIREFWARNPSSKIRPRLFERIYPYLARSPRHAEGMALEFWKQGLERRDSPGFSHEPRWRTTSLLKKFYSEETRESLAREAIGGPLDALPPDFREWDLVSRAQYLELITIFPGYLLSSQGDRMLMGNSVEGRFPYLDPDVIDFACRLPALYKLAGLEEKQILKKAARGLVPGEILRRKKQPYRAPDAVCFVGRKAPEYAVELLSPGAVRGTGIFNPAAVESLVAKCGRVADAGEGATPFSNSDNMAVLGILSMQLLVSQCVQSPRSRDGGDDLVFTTAIDRTPGEGAVSREK